MTNTTATIAAVKEIKNKLKSLQDEKIILLKSLMGLEQKFNDLASDAESGEEWINALPIKSLHELNLSANDQLKRSNLGDWKKRSILRKDGRKAMNTLESLNNQIKLTKMDLISAKIEQTLSR